MAKRTAAMPTTDGTTLIPNNVKQAAIVDILAWRTKGWILECTVDDLTARGTPTKTGKSKRWTHQAVSLIALCT